MTGEVTWLLGIRGGAVLMNILTVWLEAVCEKNL